MKNILVVVLFALLTKSMKSKLFTGILFFCSLHLSAQQNPLIGTCQYKSGDTLQSIKIITPTHWMIFNERIKENKKEFIRSAGGIYSIDGNKYVEHIHIATWEDYGQEKTNYTYKVTGDTFHQKGTLILGDGTKVDINEKWQRVNLPPKNNPAVGTWNQLSSKGVDTNGKQLWSHTNATHIRYMTITPTRWMRINLDNNNVDALGGTYRIEGNKVNLNFELQPSHHPSDITQRVEGNKLYWNLVLHTDNGKIMVEDAFEKVTPQTAKRVSTK
jgi:hypothetical protein